MLIIMSVSPLHCYLWDTPTSLSLLWEQNRMFLLNIYTDNCPARFYNLQMYPFLVYFFPLAANSELFSYWLKSAVIPGHTKSPNTQELSFYLQKSWRLCFIFPAIRINTEPIFCISRGPILTCLSEGLLIFHNWFACFHPRARRQISAAISQIKYWWKTHMPLKKYREGCPALLLGWYGDFSLCLWRKSVLGFFALLVSLFLLLLHDNGYWK